MQRILVVVAILYVIWRVLHAYGRRIARRAQGAEDYSQFSGRSRERRAQRDMSPQPSDQQLVKCPGCGTYVPEARLMQSADGGGYCSETCRRSHLLKASDASDVG